LQRQEILRKKDKAIDFRRNQVGGYNVISSLTGIELFDLMFRVPSEKKKDGKKLKRNK
jgi:hypothetical protein